ncbi:hypothetical protein JCM14202_695 [Agrilactobacillus composti DSM 18527 = JCM 14202]|nr:TIM barrel protein [Agrilactobacillus composti]GAF38864.1 hypothetical protein JCM14202_695 [Agrilactobacillus composti DSM 18527 = JCM 14202]
MKLGLRAHDITIFDDIPKLAQRLNDLNFDYIQFAPRASMPGVTNHGQNINFGLANKVKHEFEKQGIQVAVLGCYINMIHPDISERTAAMKLFQKYLTMVRYFGGNLVGTETGSVDPNFNLTAKNYEPDIVELAIQQIKTLTLTAEKVGNLIGVEPGVNHPIHSLAVSQSVLDNVKSPNLQIILDAANLVHDSTQKISEIVKNAITQFGDRIYAFHIKDYVVENGRAKVVPVGEGMADLQQTLAVIQQYQPDAFVILDETPQENFARSLERINLLTNDLN